jgi:predicted glycosyltransferase
MRKAQGIPLPFSILVLARIWIDLSNSPHVPFFRALLPEFEERGHEVQFTVRDFAQTVEMAVAAGLPHTVIGVHGGRSLKGKGGNLLGRASALARWARGRAFDLAVSHNSYAQITAGRLLRLKTTTLMDYEHQPANHLAFRLATRVIVPRAFPQKALRSFGAREIKVARYDGTKEDVYLAGFEPDPQFIGTLAGLGIDPLSVLVTVRPPARDALYHRFDNVLFEALLEHLSLRRDVQVIVLPRTGAQRTEFVSRARPNMIVPETALDGANLIAASDLVVSAGGTMNREAAALGAPAATIYAGEWAAIDEQLLSEGRLIRINDKNDIEALRIEKKQRMNPRRAVAVQQEVADLILEGLN